MERAEAMARESGAEVIAHLDSDEFYSDDSADWLFSFARRGMVEVKTVTWTRDGKARDLGESEWHRRLWPSSMPVEIARNEAWVGHPRYNGNPEHHPIARPRDPAAAILRAHGEFHHHLHYALGDKAMDTETAETTIPGWASGGVEVGPKAWPDPLRRWSLEGARPSAAFSAPEPEPARA